MNPDDFTWESPPDPSTGQKGRWAAVANVLAQRPGEWAIVAAGRTPTNYGAIHKRLKDLGCEAVGRKQSDGSYSVYARWPKPT